MRHWRQIAQAYYDIESEFESKIGQFFGKGRISSLISRGREGRAVASTTSFSGERDADAVGVATGEASGADAAMEMVLLGRSNT